jgi:hypothetical protein
MINIKNNNSNNNTIKQLKTDSEDLDNFDWVKYIQSYDDLRDINSEFDAKKHWINFGKKENRKYFIINNVIENTNNNEKNNINNLTNEIKYKLLQKKFTQHNFDWEKYLNYYDDLKNSSLKTRQDAWNHWLIKGIKENRVDFLINNKEKQKVLFNKKIDENTQKIDDDVEQIDDDVEKLYKDVEKIDENVEQINENVKKIDENVKKIDENVEKIDENVKKIDENVKKIDENIEKIPVNNEKIDNNNNEKINNDNEKQLQYINFDWKNYIHYYNDLLNIENKNDAWNHWIHHGKKEGRFYCDVSKLNMNTKEYLDFTWEDYISNYKDLSTYNTKQKAWIHWVYFGKNENRVTYNKLQKEIIDFNILKTQLDSTKPLTNKLIDLKFKKKYNNYGIHYYGWKMVINQFVNMVIECYNNTNDILLFSNQIFFDEWIEKLMIWGNKIEKQKILDKINKKKYNIISFIHNPPYLKYYENNLTNLQKEVFITDELLLNQNLFNELDTSNINNRFIYLYTFSLFHKKYIYDNFPNYKNKIVSLYHPIDTNTEEDKLFDFNLFKFNKKIFHIGWWLRNFKTFTDLNISGNYSKWFLIKNDFKESWDNFVKNNKNHNFNIIENLSNNDYENIFKQSCVFIDLEDCVANNTILECIKFNTPIITRRHPSIEEYIGKDYPLFFESHEDLLLLNDENLLDDLIYKANIYLSNMDKKHISLNTFNNKLIYDIHKLKIDNNNMLTWCCFINENISKEKFDNFIKRFKEQSCNNLLHLKFFINENFYNNLDNFNIELKIYINTVLGSNSNIFLVISNNNTYKENIFNLCSQNIKTEYFNIIGISDIFDNNYSKLHIDYLNTNVNCDITTTSYTVFNNKKNKNKVFVHKNNKMIFLNKIKKYNFSLSGIIWRSKIFEIINFCNETEIYNYENCSVTNILSKCIINNLNIINISDNSNMLIKTKF